MGIYVVRKEGADDAEEPETVGVVIEGVELFSELRSISYGWVMLFGLIYTVDIDVQHKHTSHPWNKSNQAQICNYNVQRMCEYRYIIQPNSLRELIRVIK
uniref:Uncharacterized protein n=1 Tax=Larimichthys crocea TaxID=215358 RepID=A0A0F8C656_LARCR